MIISRNVKYINYGLKVGPKTSDPIPLVFALVPWDEVNHVPVFLTDANQLSNLLTRVHLRISCLSMFSRQLTYESVDGRTCMEGQLHIGNQQETYGPIPAFPPRVAAGTSGKRHQVTMLGNIASTLEMGYNLGSSNSPTYLWLFCGRI